MTSVLAQRAVEDSPCWTRAVEGHSASIPEEVTSELGGIISSLVQWPQLRLATPPSMAEWRKGKDTSIGARDV